MRHSLILLVASATAQQLCYYPSGTQTDSSTVPCNSTTTGHVHCCAAGDTCISNGFCFGAAQAMIYRGACTDPNFGDGCPQDCIDLMTDNVENIWKCPAPYDQDLFWCGTNSAKMCQDDRTFSWPNGRLMTIAGATTTNASAANITDCETSTTTVTAVVGGSNSTSTDNNGKVSWTVALGAGLGVGLPLAIAMCAFAFLFAREKKLRKQEREQVLAGTAMTNGHGSIGTTREDRKLLASNEVYEMYDSNLQEIYTKPDVHEGLKPPAVESPVTPTPVSPLGGPLTSRNEKHEQPR